MISLSKRGLFLVCLYAFLSASGHAEVFEVPNSTSPDGKYDLALEAEPDDLLDGTARLLIRKKSSKQILGNFFWSQYGVNSFASFAIKPLWNEDSSAFALSVCHDKAWGQATVFGQQGSKWNTLPVPEFHPKYDSNLGWQDRGKGGYVARSWLKGNLLKMEYEDSISRRNNQGELEGLDCHYWVYLEYSDGAEGPRLKIMRSEVADSEEKPK